MLSFRGGSLNKRKMHWLSWDNLCHHKFDGGMGFRDFENFNKALLANQVWRIIRFPNSLLYVVLKSLYFPNTDILTVEEPKHCSFFWKGLLWSRDLLVKGLRKIIDTGDSIFAHKDKWIPRASTFKVFSSNNSNPNLLVADLINEHRSWNIPMLVENFSFVDCRFDQ